MEMQIWGSLQGSWSNTALSQQSKTWGFHKAWFSRKARILTCGGLQSTEGQIILGGAVCVIFAVLHPPLEKEPPHCSRSINYGCSDSGLIPRRAAACINSLYFLELTTNLKRVPLLLPSPDTNPFQYCPDATPVPVTAPGSQAKTSLDFCHGHQLP